MFQKAFMVTFAALSAVILFELFLRFSPFSYGLSPVVYDKDVGMWHKKNFSSRIIKECYQVPFFFDEKGLIKNAYDYDESRKDIIVIGDSYIEALMVHNQNIIHNALFDAYNGHYNFINYGMSETSPVQQFIMMEKKVDFHNVKTVLQFIRIESDIYDVDPSNMDATARPKAFLSFSDLEHYTLIPPKKQDFKEKVRDILGHFELYIFLKKSVFFLKNTLGEGTVHKEKKLTEDLSKNWLQIQGALYQTKKLLEKKGVDYIVLLYGKEGPLNETLIAFLKAQHIVYYDIVMLAKAQGATLEGFPCDSHWTDKTHRLVAELIKKEGVLP